MKKIFFLLLSILIMTQENYGQNINPFHKQWEKADSLLNKNLPQSAIKEAAIILAAAEQNRDVPNMLRAQIFIMNAASNSSENFHEQVIAKAQKKINAGSGIEKAVWSATLANFYYRYYQANRYQILQRTALEEDNSEDFKTWDATHFLDVVSKLYLQSLEAETQLQAAKASDYLPLMIKGENDAYLEWTLYDVLASRALSFFKNTERGILAPENSFEINDDKGFLPAADFVKQDFNTKDSQSFSLQTLKIYQRLIAFRLNKEQQFKTHEGLIDWDLSRLEYVHQYSVAPNKDELYFNSLKQYLNPGNKNLSQSEVNAAYQLASFLYKEENYPLNYNSNQFVPNYEQGAGNEQLHAKRDLPFIKQYLESVVSNAPDGIGKVNVQNLLYKINTIYFSLKAEEVYLPGEAIKVLLTYMNTPKIHLAVFPCKKTLIFDDDAKEADYAKELLAKQKPIAQWVVAPKGVEDKESHSTEIKIDALAYGSYYLVAYDGDDSYNTKNKNLQLDYVKFQVSNLSLVSFSENYGSPKYITLNRKTGYPESNVEGVLYTQEYKTITRKYIWAKLKTALSQKGGQIALNFKDDDNYRRYYGLLSKGNDTLVIPNIYKRSEYNSTKKEKTFHTFIFTDRSIYRPGQTVYFKGITVSNISGTAETQVVPDLKTVVTFKDANNQKISDIELATNEYGSFSGIFKVPESGLTGNMSITSAYGYASISVEEYKRPKFYVEFDELKGDYNFGMVKVKGFAKAYAGNNIDGAVVNYHVTRKARFPYYWLFYMWGQPGSIEKEITHGKAITNDDGSFEIEFDAQPDKSINPETLPIFSYEVNVDITDQNGETRSGSRFVQAGYRNMQIVAHLPMEGFAEDYENISVTTQNLNGVFTAGNLEMSIQKLKSPGKIYRKRLWQKPDQPIMSKDEFHQYFPDDEYDNESDYRYWNPESVLFQQQFKTEKNGKISIPKNIWKEEGWHLLTWKGKDEKGRTIEEKQYAYIILPQKKKKPEKAFVTNLKASLAEPGNESKIWMNTGFSNPYIISVNSLKEKSNEQGWIKHHITENDRGGYAYEWFYLYNNRKYTAKESVFVPWSNKELSLEWATHRDKLEPGAKETWTVTIKGDKKENVAAELVAGMYDASLDALKGHNWNWSKYQPNNYFYVSWDAYTLENTNNSLTLIHPTREKYYSYSFRYPQWDDNIGYKAEVMYGYRMASGGGVAMRKMSAGLAENDAMMALDEAAPPSPSPKAEEEVITGETAVKLNPENEVVTDIPVRKNLQETAFFFPELRTNENGDISFTFTMPEALTEWKMMAMAHTKDWRTGYLSGKVKTQKDLMVQPNLPRFLRQGDDITISTKVVNMSEQSINGVATLEIINALTNQPLGLPFRLSGNQKKFSIEKDRSTAVDWNIHVPEAIYQPVIIRIVAKAGNFSDGEENTLSVLSNRMLVTETMPLPVKGPGMHHFRFDNLLKSATGADATTLVNFNYTVEFTGNPAWYAVQALPYLMEYPFECSEQVFSRFYANALAAHIVQQSPKIEKIFREWEQKDTTALLSNLEKNQELKTALLEETPWVYDAQSETEQKHRIALLFESHKIAKGLKQNLSKLSKMQLPNGAFPWFVGMYESRSITQQIVAGMGKLQHLGIKAADNSDAQKIVENALLYLDEQIQKDYDNLIKYKADLKKQQIGYTQIQYLYLRSFFTKQYPVAVKHQKVFDYYKGQAVQYWANFNPYMEGMLAIALNRLNEAKTAQQIIAALKETAVHNEELGMYWKANPGGYYWYQAPIEAQSMLIAAFEEVGHYPEDIADMKTWLLKNKQTSNWRTTTATTDAIYALLLSGGDWLAYEPTAVIQVGQQTLDLSKEKTQAGTGYFKKSFQRTAISPEMGNISISVQNPTGTKDIPVSWGAVYWQYFQDMDKIGKASSPLHIEKELYIQENTSSGPVLKKITDGNKLKVGSKVKVRIILKTDRDMDYIHLKDMRGATFEPVNVLSGYRYSSGIGYYMSTLDASTNFFFDRLQKGTYVLEYQVFAGQKGSFSNGISTVQCMYAPEFSSHSEGIRVVVE